MDLKKLLSLYIKENLEVKKSSFRVFGSFQRNADVMLECSSNLNSFIENEKTDDRFQKLLFKYIDSKDLKDSEVYKKAGIDRRLFSKIRNEGYHPGKNTIISLALALELNEDEALSLLASASYYLPKNNIFDLIIRFCFINKIYDVVKVNELLFDNNCELL